MHVADVIELFVVLFCGVFSMVVAHIKFQEWIDLLIMKWRIRRNVKRWYRNLPADRRLP